jgi:Domain of unknown function (DUF4190)
MTQQPSPGPWQPPRPPPPVPPPGQQYWHPQGPPPPGYGSPESPGINGLAIASMICSVTWTYGPTSLLAIIFGLIAKRQIRERGQRGGAMATAGIVIGSIGLVIAIVLIAVFILAAASEDSVGVY